MIIGEDKNKIKNIVRPAFLGFNEIYSSLIEEYLESNPLASSSGKWRIKVKVIIDCLFHS